VHEILKCSPSSIGITSSIFRVVKRVYMNLTEAWMLH